MAVKKRGRKKKVVDVGSKPGRKKEIKRFEMTTLVGPATVEVDSLSTPKIEWLGGNQIAFVITTSGGTPLNQTDVGKLYRLLQHELRALGHKLKRKGQELDPKEPEPKPSEEAPEESKEPEPSEEQDETPESTEPEAVALPNPSLADPDNSDPNN